MSIHLAFLAGAGDVEPVQEWQRQWPDAVLMFCASSPRTHLTPTTCTPSSLALSRRCLQSLREQPKVIAMSLSWHIASVATCSSSLNTEKQVRRRRETQIRVTAIKTVAFKSHENQCEDCHQDILGFGVAAGNLAQLHFVITHQQFDTVLSSILHLG